VKLEELNIQGKDNEGKVGINSGGTSEYKLIKSSIEGVAGGIIFGESSSGEIEGSTITGKERAIGQGAEPCWDSKQRYQERGRQRNGAGDECGRRSGRQRDRRGIRGGRARSGS